MAQKNGVSGDRDQMVARAIRNALREQADVRRKFRFTTWEELETEAEETLVWTIDGMLEDGCFGVVYGPPGAAKTYLAIDMAACVATGASWQGRKTIPGLVVYAGGLLIVRQQGFRLRWTAQPHGRQAA